MLHSIDYWVLRVFASEVPPPSNPMYDYCGNSAFYWCCHFRAMFVLCVILVFFCGWIFNKLIVSRRSLDL